MTVLPVDEFDDPDIFVDQVLCELIERYGLAAILASLADLVQEKRE